jgi:hypothetical protein
MDQNARPTVNLGDMARDTISGFQGVVVAVTEWLNGCRRATIQPRELKDGKPIEAFTFDVEQVEVLGVKAAPEGTKSGGPCPDPIRASVPR